MKPQDNMPAPWPRYAGPIQAEKNGRYFVDQRGVPFFWLGDTAWPLYTAYSKNDAAAYLETRARQGFTAIQGVIAWGNPESVDNLAGTPPMSNYAGELPWVKAGPEQPNAAYFEHVDYVIDLASDLGLTMVIWPTQGVSIVQTKVFNPANAYTYARWIGERYRNRPNIVWVTGCDREPMGYEDIYRALAQGLRDGDGGAHLITYHTCGLHSSSYYFHKEPWLDFNMVQTWTEWTKVYAAVQTDMMMTPVKPVVLAEGAYEDGVEYPMGPITPTIVRKQAWWAFMAGAGFTYGHFQNWRMDKGWQRCWESEGAWNMSLFRAIAQSRPWWKMVPDQALFASGVSSDRTLNTAIRTIDRTCAMLYMSSPCHVRVALDRIVTPRVRATWVNPADGQTVDASEYKTGNGIPGATFPEWVSEWFSTPARWDDAILVLDGSPRK